MKKFYPFITMAFGLSLAVALLWVLGVQNSTAGAAPAPQLVQVSHAPSAELHVCPIGCTYASVQAAVDIAGSGDVIKVAAGTYAGVQVRPRDDITTTGTVTQVVYLKKSLTIQGGFTTGNWTTPDPEANLTTLDAQGQGRVLYITGVITPTIEGLRLTGGDAAGMGGEPTNPTDCGGGIYVYRALATIRNNWVFSNTAETGAGIFVGDKGWGLSKPGASLIANTVFSNTAQSGGGIALTRSTTKILSNVIRGNSASQSGGGIHLLFGAPLIKRNLISANSAGQGGGAYFQWSESTLVNNVIIDNQIGGGKNGSGLHNQGGNLRLFHNTLARNTGGDSSGIYLVELEDWGLPTIWMTNTILAHQSIGVYANGISTVTINGILWHAVPVTVQLAPTAVGSVANQHTGEPAFAADGFHITFGSAAIDSGVEAGVTIDYDGELRPAQAGHDLGADEFLYQLMYLPLIALNQ
jgi:hypothetical protein